MTIEDVNPLKPDGSSKSPEEIQAEVDAGNATPAPGSQTNPVKLLEALRDEREKRHKLEERITLLESSASPDLNTEEAKDLLRLIQESNVKIDALTQENAKKDVLIAHPVLKEKWEDFEKYRLDPENKGMNLRTAAKSFLVENGLLDAKRPGLEKPTGGDRVPPSTKMSVEEIKTLRETNFKLYQDMLAKGQIKV